MFGRRLKHWRMAMVVRLRTANVYALDCAIAVVVAIPVSAQFANAKSGWSILLGGLLNAGTVVPLVWRRRAPFAMAVTIAVFALAVSEYHRPGQILQYGALVATYTVADLGRPWQRRVFLGCLVLIVGPGALLAKHYDAPDFLLTLLLPLSAYLVGALTRINRARAEALQEWADQLARIRKADVARAAVEERARIARDMHDLLAHAVSIMVVQAEAGPVVVRSDPRRAERAFDVIADAGRDAMAQLRAMLGVLNGDGIVTGTRSDVALGPQPTVAAVPSLVRQMERTDLRVDFQSTGEPGPLSREAEVAAYRIVQEALTNAVKHADAGTATVRFDWTNTGLAITVTDDGKGMDSAAAGFGNGGHGLIGIRERATACGGQAEAGPVPGSGFRVTAQLPYIAMPSVLP
jgi:signal transduction histidine kinase